MGVRLALERSTVVIKETKLQWLIRNIANPTSEYCILWPFPVPEDNHPAVNIDGRKEAPHRLAYKLHYGQYPEPQGIRTCQIERCVNPLHVTPGDTFDNGIVRAAKNNTNYEWLKQQIATRTAEGCWKWPYSCDKFGYGRLWLPDFKKNGMAHIAAFYIVNGRLPKDKVLHKCDCPSCFRPDHLVEGSQIDNIRDMHEKGRAVIPVGERAGASKLTEDQVREIRKLAAAGASYGELSRQFGVWYTCIGQIVRRESWKHIA